MKKARILALLTPLALSGCDSGLPMRADLGQAGAPPALEATLGPPGAAGQPIAFAARGGGDFGGDLGRARTARVVLGGLALPLAATGSTASTISTLSATVPATVALARPLAGAATESVVFVLDGDRALVAWVSYK
ncbi:MAG: hypothetical protein FJZ01_26485 [Candidatus Sericytochromatia bacterium]|nr:hypothetical protein [Candidatus Tanganyikabacteria bacterium]